MEVPNYAIVSILLTSMFIAAALSTMISYGALKSQINPVDIREFVLKLVAYMFAWVVIVLALSYTEYFDVRTGRGQFLGPFIVVTTLLANISLGRSKTFGSILDAIPTNWIATVQIYRIIGIVFLLLLADGILSSYFAFSTGWGDIIIGATAPMTGYLLYKNPIKHAYIGVIWCIAGFLDLVLVLIKALTSAPGPLQIYSTELPTVIIGIFPFSIIPFLVVPISLTLHVQLIRKILRQKGTPVLPE